VKRSALIATLCLGVLSAGCVPAAILGGAAVGAAGTAAVVEHRKQVALEELDGQFERGEISKEEYLERKREIENTGAVR
jgi:uncharacterized cupredoxin-like copper-binding protein